MKKILSCALAYNVHDSSVSFALDSRVVLVLQAERVFKRKKKKCNKKDMERLIKYGLAYLGKEINDVAYWAIATLKNPDLKQKDIIDSQTGLPSRPYWKELIICGQNVQALVVNHHLAHAATYLISPFEQSVVVTCDGGGDYLPATGVEECLSVYRGEGDKLTRMNLNLKGFTTGRIYHLCSSFIYNHRFSEGKLMALASLGKVRKKYWNIFEKLQPELETVDYGQGNHLVNSAFPGWLKGTAQGSEPSTEAKDYCATLQSFFVKKRLTDLSEIFKQLNFETKNLVLAGGTALNLDLNSSIHETFSRSQFIFPCCDDTGQSLGALAILIQEVYKVRPIAQLPYLGMGADEVLYDKTILDKVVNILLSDGVIVVCNGRAEVGPRALGNRSLICRPDSLKMKHKLSVEIKQREKYRPVAPVVIEEKTSEYFIGPENSPFMLYKYKVRPEKKKEIVGGVHSDGSARLQTVGQDQNPFFYDLIKRFGEVSGKYVLLNTSLNFKGDPIANDKKDSWAIYDKIPGPKVFICNGRISELSED